VGLRHGLALAPIGETLARNREWLVEVVG